MNSVIYGDARHLPFLDNSVNCAITSPPFFGLRSYGDDPREIGRGTLDEYLDDIRVVAKEVFRVLRADGTFWLNIGDTASGSGGAGGDYLRGGRKEGLPMWRQGDSGIAPGQWCLVPARIALLLQSDGWLLRSWITWDKGRVRPESPRHVRRPGVSSEVLLMLVKGPKYEFHPEYLEEPGDVWHFPPARGNGHLAPFPLELPLRCIRLSTSPGQSVLDPFVGSGSTLQAAARLGRDGLGIDLYSFEGKAKGAASFETAPL